MFADASHTKYAEHICQLIYESALQRGTGIAKRSPEYISEKITGGKSVVALDGDRLVGSAISRAGNTAISLPRRVSLSIPNIGTVVLPSRSRTRRSNLHDDDFPMRNYSVSPHRCRSWNSIRDWATYLSLSRNWPTTTPSGRVARAAQLWHTHAQQSRRMCLCTGMLYDPAKHADEKRSRLAPYFMYVKNIFKKVFHLK